MRTGLIASLYIAGIEQSKGLILKLDETPNHLILAGNNNSGKTRLLGFICQKLTNDTNRSSKDIPKENEKIKIDYIDASEPATFVYANKYMLPNRLIANISNNEAIIKNKPFIVIIDAIDAHLDLEKQREMLPLLIKTFPTAQFIVSTYSPFVISSSENALAYNITNGNIIKNPNMYSYQSIIEDFFDMSTYSKKTVKLFNRYRALYLKDIGKKINSTEKKEITEIANQLSNAPLSSRELYFAFKYMEEKRHN